MLGQQKWFVWMIEGGLGFRCCRRSRPDDANNIAEFTMAAGGIACILLLQ